MDLATVCEYCQHDESTRCELNRAEWPFLGARCAAYNPRPTPAEDYETVTPQQHSDTADQPPQY